MARIRPYDRPETIKQHATLHCRDYIYNSCSLFAVSVSNDRRVGDAATATQCIARLYILPCRSTTLPLTIATIAGSSVVLRTCMYCNRHVLKYRAHDTRKIRVFHVTHSVGSVDTYFFYVVIFSSPLKPIVKDF